MRGRKLTLTLENHVSHHVQKLHSLGQTLSVLMNGQKSYKQMEGKHTESC